MVLVDKSVSFKKEK